MESFELNRDTIPTRHSNNDEVSPSSLRQTGDESSFNEPADETPTVERQRRTRRLKTDIDAETTPTNSEETSKATDTTHNTTPRSTEQHENIKATVRFFRDGRLRIFFGIFMILLSGYMLIASISYLSTYSADQSIVVNSTASQISASHDGVDNSAGWVGAFLSHLLMYKWLGLGGFIVIFYIGALGISLVRLHRFKFWQLTFKSLVAAIAVSIIAGFLTHSITTPTLWGGEHGYWVNEVLISSASVWGALAVSILMAAALVLIFIGPIRTALRHLRRLIANRRASIAERYRSSMAAARSAMDDDKTSATHGKRSVAEPEDEEIHPIEQTEIDQTQHPATDTRAELSEIVTTSGRGFHDDSAKPISVTVSDSNNHTSTQKSINDRYANRFESHQPDHEAQTSATTSDHNGDNNESADTKESGTTQAAMTLEDIPTSISTAAPIVESTVNSAVPTNDPDDLSDYYDPTADLSNYRFPELDLLEQRENHFALSEQEQEENNQTIVSTLGAYGIKIESISATVGPTITLYEIVPQKGTRVSSIKRLGDDMALSLSAIGIRIIAPIPGKGTIGMEVPNKKPQIVSIRSILSSQAYHESTAELPIALGTTIDNKVYVADLAKVPHLLVAGATGMGKSVGLNTIIASLLYKKHPAELKFVLVDPKRVELSLYKCLEKHFLAKLPDEEEPIIIEPGKVIATLNSLCIEMENRYDLLSKAGTRSIKEYNQKFIQRKLLPTEGHRFMPYIVVVIDEFADLILTAGKDIETPISRIAAKARAIGIHLILATQRPSVNVITGVIKANFPGRMAFRVTQMNDSRTIIDRPGAEQLIGRGDMLISRDGVIDRVQCAFIDTDEVDAMCKFIARQQSYPMAYELPEEPAASSDGAGRGMLSDRDEMFADAGRAVIEAGMGSASLLQRKFNIGYPRAGKLIDQLEACGVVGPQVGAGKPRQILMDMYSFERMLE
ncbi:MAG: DNA translocase FtsK [Bacteroides sp.]|nr:DNA translocase FtsK [Bacteroides sp.]MCM1413311.1 DNA translocase FtsK [Bacteroides sp.]MCM1472003.1 DNA translocase FtsK [Bacteroides sp.]